MKKTFSSSIHVVCIVLCGLVGNACIDVGGNNPIKEKLSGSTKNKVNKTPSITAAESTPDRLIFTGTNLDLVKSLRVTGNSQDKTLDILSQTSTEIQAATSGTTLSLIASYTYSLIINTASAQTILPINFYIFDSSITTVKLQNSAVTTDKIATKNVTLDKIATTGASDGQVLTYSSTTGYWAPKTPGSGTGGGLSSLTAGVGLKSGGNNPIKGSGTISVDIGLGTAANQIPYFNSSNELGLSGGPLRIQTNDNGFGGGVGSDASYIKFINYDDDDSDGIVGAGELNFELQIHNNGSDIIFGDYVDPNLTSLFSIDKNGGATSWGVFNITDDGTATIGLDQMLDDNTNAGLLMTGGFLCVGDQTYCQTTTADANNYQLRVNGKAAKSDGSSTWSTVSDLRSKNILGSYDKGLEELMQIPLYRWQYKNSKDKIGFNIGPVAQEVLPFFPEAVAKNVQGQYVLSPDALWWAYLNALKELNREVASLKEENAKLKSLETKLGELEKKNDELTNYLCQKDEKAPFCQSK